MSIVIPLNLSTVASQILRIIHLYPANPSFNNYVNNFGFAVFPDVSTYQRDLAKISTAFPYSFDEPYTLLDAPGVFSLPKNAYSSVLPSFLNSTPPNAGDTYSIILIDMTIAPLSSGLFNLRVDYLDSNQNQITEYLTTPFWAKQDSHPLEVEQIKDYTEGAINFLQKEIDIVEKDALSLLNRLLLKGEMVSGELYATKSSNVQPPNSLQSHVVEFNENIQQKFIESKQLNTQIAVEAIETHTYSITAYPFQSYAGDTIYIGLNKNPIIGDVISLNGKVLTTSVSANYLSTVLPKAANFNYNFNLNITNKGIVRSNTVILQMFSFPNIETIQYESGTIATPGETITLIGNNFGNIASLITYENGNITPFYWTNNIVSFIIPNDATTGFFTLNNSNNKDVIFQLKIVPNVGTLEIVPNVNIISANQNVNFLVFLDGEQVSANWSLEDNTGNIGNGTVIHGNIGASGNYIAPSQIDFPFNLSVDANYTTNIGKYFGKASLTVGNTSDTLTMAPSGSNIVLSNTLQLFVYDNNAIVDNTLVQFYINGILNGNSTYGTITRNGLYLAPSKIPNNNTVNIQATYNGESTIMNLHITDLDIAVSEKAPFPTGQIGGNLNGTYEENITPVSGDGSLAISGVQKVNGYGYRIPSGSNVGYGIVSPINLLHANYPGVTAQTNYMGGILYNYEYTTFLMMENTDGTLTFIFTCAAWYKNISSYTNVFGLQGLMTNDNQTSHQLTVQTSGAGSLTPGVMSLTQTTQLDAASITLTPITESFISGNSLTNVPPGADPVMVQDSNGNSVLAFRIRLHPPTGSPGTVVSIRWIGDSVQNPDQYIYWALGGDSTEGIYDTEQGGWFGYQGDGLQMTLNGQVAPPAPQIISAGEGCPGNAINVYGKYFSTDTQIYFNSTNQILPRNGVPTTTDGINYVISVNIPNNVSNNAASYSLYANGSTGKSNTNVQMSVGSECAITFPLTLSITPNSANIYINSSQQYIATLQLTDGTIIDVTNSVSWYANSIQGGSQSSGFINNGGDYFAPGSIPTSNPVGVKATYNYQGQPLIANASATIITVYNSPAPVAPPLTHNGCYMLKVSPGNATIGVPGIPQQFTAQLYIDDANPQTVNATSWSVNGITGGNSYYGTINSHGLYTPPTYYPPEEFKNFKVMAFYTATTPTSSMVALSGYSIISFNQNTATAENCNVTVSSQININFGDSRSGYIPAGTSITMQPGQYLLATYSEILNTFLLPEIDNTSQSLPLFLDTVQANNLPTYLYNEGTLQKISGGQSIEDFNDKYTHPYTVVLGICDPNNGAFQSYWDLIPVIQPVNNTIPAQTTNCIVSHSMEEKTFPTQLESMQEKLISNKKIDMSIINKNNSMWFGQVELTNDKLIIHSPIKLLKFDENTQKMNFIYQTQQPTIDIKSNQVLFFNGKELVVADLTKNISTVQDISILGVYLDKFYPSSQFISVINSEERTIINVDENKNGIFAIGDSLIQWGTFSGEDAKIVFNKSFKNTYNLTTSIETNIINKQLDFFEIDKVKKSINITWLAMGS